VDWRKGRKSNATPGLFRFADKIHRFSSCEHA
jgi:hypothetical protein